MCGDQACADRIHRVAYQNGSFTATAADGYASNCSTRSKTRPSQIIPHDCRRMRGAGKTAETSWKQSAGELVGYGYLSGNPNARVVEGRRLLSAPGVLARIIDAPAIYSARLEEASPAGADAATEASL